MEKLPQAESKHSIISELRGTFKAGLKHQVPDRKKIVLTREEEIGCCREFREALWYLGLRFPKPLEPDPEFISALQRCRRELLKTGPALKEADPIPTS